MPADLLPWSVAWERAAFGPKGFYRRERPRDHFATDVNDGTAVARRLATVASPVLERLVGAGHRVTVTDVGSGDGQLIRQLAERLDPALAARVVWRAIDLRPRPDDLPPWITWIPADLRDWAARASTGAGLVIAHEVLDDLPCDVVEVDDEERRRIVLVDPATGEEVLGPPTTDVGACAALGVDGPSIDAWCDAWWPRRTPAGRIEVGRSRDEAWRALADTVTDGLAVAIDYGHVRAERDTGLWDGGTLASFRQGRRVSVTADGSANLTAHVAMDSCAAAVPDTSPRLEPSPEGLWWLVHEMGR